jgi:hypothetical protein
MNGIQQPRLTHTEMAHAAKQNFGSYLMSLTRVELQSIAFENHLSRSGNKDELVRRILLSLPWSLEKMAEYAEKYYAWTFVESRREYSRQSINRKRVLMWRNRDYYDDVKRWESECHQREENAEAWLRQSRNDFWREAAAMGGLQRLGAQSRLRHLDHGVMDMVLRQVQDVDVSGIIWRHRGINPYGE